MRLIAYAEGSTAEAPTSKGRGGFSTIVSNAKTGAVIACLPGP